MPVLAVLLGLLSGAAMAAAKPNILYIFSDDHALRTISAYAGEGAINRTPNIDRLAEQGAVFTRSFCGNSICQLSRASILTGKHNQVEMVLSVEIDPAPSA